MAKKVTLADVKTFVSGKTKVKVMCNTTGHNYPLGKTYLFYNASGNSISLTDPDTKWLGTWAGIVDCEILVSRAEEADALQFEVDKMTAEIATMTDQIARLRKYKDDNDELAHLVSETIKSDGSPASIYTLLTKFRVTL